MRKQYNFRPSANGFDAWDVHHLVELSRGLPVETVPLDQIRELDTAYWFFIDGVPPTVREVVAHAKLIELAELSYPIILAPDGQVMDGMHRVARALLEGRTEIAAVRLTYLPEPTFRDCQPDELPY